MRGTILPIGYGQFFHKWRRKPDTNISFNAGLSVGKGTRHTGSVTPPTIGDTDLDRYVLDHEGTYRGVKAEEARFYGARRVENLVIHSQDFEALEILTTIKILHLSETYQTGSLLHL